jgi:YfiH family protein
MLRMSVSDLDFEGSVHAFFGRTGGLSPGIYASLNCGPGSGDNREHVIENRRRAMLALANEGAGLATLYQVHGREAVIVREPWEIGSAPRADAMATDVPGFALGILTADCAPVLLADPQARIIGAAHAGWKGALAGVVESAVAAMEQRGAQRDRIAAAIGPCISQCSYEVGDDLRTSVAQARADDAQFFAPSDRAGHWRFDLGGYVRARLQNAGVEKISVVPACTYLQEPAFFSYRRATHRSEPDYGRQLSAIMLV